MIVNPAHVLGAGDPGRSSTVLVRRFLRRQIPAYVDGTLNIVGVDDVARGHLLADERGAAGRALHPRQPELHVRPPVHRSSAPVRGRVAVAEAAGAGRAAHGGGGASRVLGPLMPPPVEVRAASLNWAFSSARAKRELGWRPSPHEDCLEETIAWYRERDGERLSPPGSRQPLALRMAGAVVRRSPLGWRPGGHAVPLHHPDELAVPVRQGGARARSRRDRVRAGQGAATALAPARGRGADRISGGCRCS